MERGKFTLNFSLAEYFLLAGKLSSTNTKYGAENLPTLEEFEGNIEILCTCWKCELSVPQTTSGALQLPAPTFLSIPRRCCLGAWEEGAVSCPVGGLARNFNRRRYRDILGPKMTFGASWRES